MAELSVSNAFAGTSVARQQTKKVNNPKDKINSILDKMDGKSGFTINDVVILGNMDKKARAKALGLDANKYDIRVDSKSGVVNILEKKENKFNPWLNRNVNNDNKVDKVQPQTQVQTQNIQNKQKFAKISCRSEFCEEFNLNIPHNTRLYLSTGDYLIDSKGQLWQHDNRKYVKCSALRLQTCEENALKILADKAKDNGIEGRTLSGNDMKKITTLSKNENFEKSMALDLRMRYGYDSPKYIVHNNGTSSNELDWDIGIAAHYSNNVSKAGHIKLALGVNADAEVKYRSFCNPQGAQSLYDNHISGISLNKNTLKAISDMDDDTFLSTVKVYNAHKVVVDVDYDADGRIEKYNKNGIITDLNEEWNMKQSQMLPIIKRFIDTVPDHYKNCEAYKKLCNLYNQSIKSNKGSRHFDENTAKQYDDLMFEVIK